MNRCLGRQAGATRYQSKGGGETGVTGRPGLASNARTGMIALRRSLWSANLIEPDRQESGYRLIGVAES